MAKYKIAWLEGDGIGKDVMKATKMVLEALNFDAEYIPADIGWEFWCKEGDALPQRTIEVLKSVDAALFGAITSKPQKQAMEELAPKLKDKGYTYRSPIVRMRQLFDLYICLRPCKAYPKNPLNYKEGIDIVVFRENTEDLYAGVEYYPVEPEIHNCLNRTNKNYAPFYNFNLNELAISCKINTKYGSQRIIRAAFEYAKTNGRKKVTIVHKANVVRATDGLFLDCAKEIAKEYPQIQMDNANIDSMTMWLLKNPHNYDVIVAPNLYGDIISDLCAQMVGGLGFGCSGNIGDKLAIFEPTHGSAPKYAGLYKVNPIATILAAKMMLEWLNENHLAQKIENAISQVVLEGETRTYDMGGTHSTLDMANAIITKL